LIDTNLDMKLRTDCNYNDSIRISDGDFAITIYPVEFDLHLPSFRSEVSCFISHPTGNFTYNASDIWFDKDIYNNFLSSLRSMINGNGSSARLECCSMYFIFEVSKIELTKLKCQISICEYQPNNENTSLKAAFILDNQDFINSLYRSLLELRLQW
jgi:hypothetical protein